MSHSGCNGGRLWRIHVYEKMGSCEVKIFDTKLEAEKFFGRQSEDCTKGVRPIRAVDLLNEWLVSKDGFPYETHMVHVVDRVLKRPLFFRRKKQ